MGVSGSLQNNPRSHEPPPLPPPFNTIGYFPSSGTSAASDERPQSFQEHDDARMSLKNEEWWHHRRNFRQPHETLLTYAAQMTGWQSECTPSAPSVNQESMELTRTVSHLAAANQQLAGAHSALLTQVERLYLELNKEREARIQLQEYKCRREEVETRGRSDDGKSHHRTRQPESENLRIVYQKAVERIQKLESELESSKKDDDFAQCTENTRWPTKNENRDPEREDRVPSLLGELSRLKNNYLETQDVNRRLNYEVEKQKKIIEQLRNDNEVSKNHCEQVELCLNDRKLQFEALMGDLESSKLEISRLTKRLDVFHLEKDTASTRIMDLERELKRINRVREETMTLASEESWRLKTRLHEEIRNKKKQNEALDEALQEIQRLNEIIDALKKEERGEERVIDAETSTEDVPTERPSLEEFKKDLSMKREARQRAIAAVSSEMDRLRRELDAEKEAHSETSKVLDLLKSQSEGTSSQSVSVETRTIIEEKRQNEWIEPTSIQRDAQRLTDVLKVSDELRACIRLQIEKIDDLRYHLECDEENNVHRITVLKNVAHSNREAFAVREAQINRLKNILSQIVARLGDEKFKIDVTDDLRTEHDRQLEDVRRLKTLYDERMRVLVEVKELTSKEMIAVKDKLKTITKEKETLDEEMKKAEEKIDAQDTEISNLESQLGLTKADCRDLQNQMSVINSLFSQMLLSASSADMDLDRLTQLLQENHELISDMAREEGTEAAALPKLLLDLVEQVEGREKTKSTDVDSEKREDGPQEENIAHNLPKVWRVLLELLSCHAVDSTTSPTSSASLSTDPNICYKSVDTPTGPRLVISVSKTYIRLKELILEKKSLEKEMGRMKQLNTHLESKLGEQEKRLSTVSSELSKTWNIVGRMQEQHSQLHTHEKILRYELQQKRKMLQELKQELEYCREKWESARQKNTNTEMEWRNLRREFAARKALAVHDSFNNSGESGFSDERGDDSDDEDINQEERLRIGSRRRTRKENPRIPTPDTESEQPTDNELPESKTGSTTTPEQTTPASEESNIQSPTTEIPDKSINSVDQALANVIQNLIQMDDKKDEPLKVLENNSNVVEESPGKNQEDDIHTTHLDVEETQISYNIQQINAQLNQNDDSTENIDTPVEEPSKFVNSIFSIGPFPLNSAALTSKTVQFSEPLVMGPADDQTSVFGTTENKTDELKVIPSTSEESTVPVESSDATDNKAINNENLNASTSTPSSSTKATRSPEEVLAARAARLKRLEEQADWLMKKMSATNRRGSALSTRLEELHEVYGEPPPPPSMPDVLPAVRIPTDSIILNQESELPSETTENDVKPPDTSP